MNCLYLIEEKCINEEIRGKKCVGAGCKKKKESVPTPPDVSTATVEEIVDYNTVVEVVGAPITDDMVIPPEPVEEGSCMCNECTSHLDIDDDEPVVVEKPEGPPNEEFSEIPEGLNNWFARIVQWFR